jgi:HEAT repeat protein
VRRLLIGCTLGLAACLVGGCGGDSEKKAEQDFSSSGVQLQKIAELAAKGVGAVKPLLQSERRPVHLAAIDALGMIKNDAEATRLLVELAKGTDVEDAYFAVIALARQRPAEAKAIIEGAFQSTQSRLREAACIASAQLGDPSLYPLLIKAAKDPDATVASVAQGMMRRHKIEEETPQE